MHSVRHNKAHNKPIHFGYTTCSTRFTVVHVAYPLKMITAKAKDSV